MKICIFGAGAVGGFLAARLAHAGRDVSVVARGTQLEAIRRSGLRLVTPDGTLETRPRCAADPAELGRQDVVIVTTKAPALPAVARAIGPLLGPDTPVVYAMNGVFWWYGHGFAPPRGRPLDLGRLDPGGLLHRHVGPERSLGMVVYSPNEVIEPGVVHNDRASNRFVLGEPGGPVTARARAIHGALDGAGFEVELTDDIRREMWRKLLSNISTAPVCALTGARSSEVVGDARARAVSRLLMEEAIEVAASHGFTDLGVDPERRTAAGSKAPHKPSMLQDLERGRPMEIDSMVGIVADFAAAAGVPTPTLDAVLALLTLRARVAGLYGEPAGPAAAP